MKHCKLFSLIFGIIIATLATTFLGGNKAEAFTLNDPLCGAINWVHTDGDRANMQLEICAYVDKNGKPINQSVEFKEINWQNPAFTVTKNSSNPSTIDIGWSELYVLPFHRSFNTADYAKFTKYVTDIQTFMSNHVNMKSFGSDDTGIKWHISDVTWTQNGKKANITKNEGGETPKDVASKADGDPTNNVDADGNPLYTSDGNPCHQNANGIGWILCPVIEALEGATKGIYAEMVEPNLQVQSALFAQDSGTAMAWSIFRDIANYAFVILFVIVIISQLTGFGIDNYGVKKILPRLIVVALLVNLSYIICQFAVDASNIIGNSIEGLLSDISQQVASSGGSSVVTGGAENAAVAFSAVVSAIGLGAAAATIQAVGLVALIPLGLTLLSAVLAVLFAFILLGVRKAGLVILVAIAPLAIVCYLLPNTSKLTQRWFNIFKGLLFVYPICGLLIGGGYLAGNILLTSVGDDWWLCLTAVIIFIAPLFAIIPLVRQSISAADTALSRLNGGLQNVGGRIRNTANAGLRNSRGVREYSENRQREQSYAHANRTANRMERRLERRRNGGVLRRGDPNAQYTTRELARIRRASAVQDKYESDNIAAIQASWRDEEGNPSLDAAKSAYNSVMSRSANGEPLSRQDTLMMRAALDVWGEKDAAGLAEAIAADDGDSALGNAAQRQRANNYIRSNGRLRAAVTTQNGTIKDYYKHLDAGGSGTYSQWGNTDVTDAAGNVRTYTDHEGNTQNLTNRIQSIQKMSASTHAAQDHTVAAEQAQHLTRTQMQQYADSPTLYNNLQEDAHGAVSGAIDTYNKSARSDAVSTIESSSVVLTATERQEQSAREAQEAQTQATTLAQTQLAATNAQTQAIQDQTFQVHQSTQAQLGPDATTGMHESLAGWTPVNHGAGNSDRFFVNPNNTSQVYDAQTNSLVTPMMTQQGASNRFFINPKNPKMAIDAQTGKEVKVNIPRRHQPGNGSTS